jgi:hypothetical protein
MTHHSECVTVASHCGHPLADRAKHKGPGRAMLTEACGAKFHGKNSCSAAPICRMWLWWGLVPLEPGNVQQGVWIHCGVLTSLCSVAQGVLQHRAQPTSHHSGGLCICLQLSCTCSLYPYTVQPSTSTIHVCFMAHTWMHLTAPHLSSLSPAVARRLHTCRCCSQSSFWHPGVQ